MKIILINIHKQLWKLNLRLEEWETEETDTDRVFHP